MAKASTALWPDLPPREFDVVGLGQCCLDHVALVDGLPRFAGKDRIYDYLQRPGGQIATALLACQRLGLRTALVSSVGDDPAAAAGLVGLQEAGVELERVITRRGVPTQLAFILVDRKSGERTVLWYRDPRLSLEVSQLGREDIERGRVLHLDAGDPDVSIWAAGVARAAGIPVVLDADTLGEGVEKVLAQVDFPIVPVRFAEDCFGSGDPEEALRGMAALGARFPVITLGDEGALGYWQGSVIVSPAFRVTTRDTTGAGDAFHGAFVASVLDGLDGPGALRQANALAAMNCRALGAQAGLPSREDLSAFLQHSGS